MKVEIGNAEFSISWLHYTGTISEGTRHQSKNLFRQTICDIVFPNGEVFTGVAVCSKKDNFCKETGRKVSLTRALQIAGFTKEARRVVWEAYFNRATNSFYGYSDKMSKVLEQVEREDKNNGFI